MRKRLSKQEKVKILILAREHIDTVTQFQGLCAAIGHTLNSNFSDYREYDLNEIFPMFTRNNAQLLFGARKEHCYWWPCTEEGDAKRLQFLDWMIQELSKKKYPFWKRLIILRNEKS